MRQTSQQDAERALERAVEEIKRKLEEGRRHRLTFLLLGRTGKGKSSTINSLFGQEVAPVGDYEPTTVKVESYDHEINGIAVRIWDTPGLCDDLEEEGNDSRYLEEVRGKIKEVDSMWFVASLDDTRVGQDEKRGIREISAALGKEIWQRAVIVFTFADKVSPDVYDEKLQKRRDLICQEISKYASNRIARHVPAVAVNNVGKTTPDGQPWLSELFVRVFVRLTDNGIAPFLWATADSITTPRTAKPPVSPGQTHLIAQVFVPQGLTVQTATSPVVPEAIASLGVATLDQFALPLSVSASSPLAPPRHGQPAPPPFEEVLPRIILNERQNKEVRNKLKSAGYATGGAMAGAGIGVWFGGPAGAVVGAGIGAIGGWIVSKLIG